MIPKALAGHHPPPGGTVQQPPPASPAPTPTGSDTNPSVLLIAGILLAVCIGGFLWSMRKK